jgi:hypothetical protein
MNALQVYGWLRTRKSYETHSTLGSSTDHTLDDDDDNPLANKYAATNKTRLRLRRLVHQSISDILDPSRYVGIYFYSCFLSFFVRDSSLTQWYFCDE